MINVMTRDDEVVVNEYSTLTLFSERYIYPAIGF